MEGTHHHTQYSCWSSGGWRRTIRRPASNGGGARAAGGEVPSAGVGEAPARSAEIASSWLRATSSSQLASDIGGDSKKFGSIERRNPIQTSPLVADLRSDRRLDSPWMMVMSPSPMSWMRVCYYPCCFRRRCRPTTTPPAA